MASHVPLSWLHFSAVLPLPPVCFCASSCPSPICSRRCLVPRALFFSSVPPPSFLLPPLPLGGRDQRGVMSPPPPSVVLEIIHRKHAVASQSGEAERRGVGGEQRPRAVGTGLSPLVQHQAGARWLAAPSPRHTGLIDSCASWRANGGHAGTPSVQQDSAAAGEWRRQRTQ